MNTPPRRCLFHSLQKAAARLNVYRCCSRLLTARHGVRVASRVVAYGSVGFFFFTLPGNYSTACPIPVYQYALEHWDADPYRVTITRGAPFSEDQDKALALLKDAERGGGLTANLTVSLRDADPHEDMEGEPRNRFEIHYPEIARIDRPVWQGELSYDNARALLLSPVRQRLAEALARRVSTVWLLLESGDRATDRELEQTIRQQAARFEREIVIPDTAEWGGQDIAIDRDIRFDVMRLDRNDPAEEMLVRMLLASEPDLETEFDGQPMLFPVFGRGLILYALVGRGINPWTMEEAVNFLTGPCSCQIKAANPGTDLLIALDWSEHVEPMTPAAVGGAVGAGSFLHHHDRVEPDQE